MKDNSVRIKAEFFDSMDVTGIARALLGKKLCTRFGSKLTTGLIVETEAYRGPDDKACHAYGYRRTRRTEDLYGKPGTGYIYVCYGIHHLFNVVTAPSEIPHAVLVRAIEPVEGINIMLKRRNMTKAEYRLTAGPGSLSVALGIKSKYTGLDITSPDSPIWIEGNNHTIPENEVVAGPRVGVESAEECAIWPWRFTVRGNPWVSRPKPKNQL